MTRVCRAGASPEQVQVRLSVVRTGTATVRTGMDGLYLATRRAVEPPRVNTMISEACTCSTEGRPGKLSHFLQAQTDTMSCLLQTTSVAMMVTNQSQTPLKHRPRQQQPEQEELQTTQSGLLSRQGVD